ncbi:MAG TPA: crossover junction endodeoxyribonuclease RuvC [Candidatus Paceibacterota bacterium]|nr:crossover junction endodeoxyribonuclease RuvC [Candidatus Paceibacterota bacterium]
MRILAIDPGYERCGIAILERQDGRDVLIYSECARTEKSLPFHERLRQIGEAVGRAIDTHAPRALAMETLYFSKNTKTAMQVAEARGVITFAAAARGLPLIEYSPAAVKIAVTSAGKADKRQVMAMVPRLISLPSRSMLDDEYDAIAIGITHLAHTR